MDEPVTDEADRLAFVAMGSAKGLPELLEAVKRQNMTLVTIHDRPLGTELGEYYYLIECEDGNYDDYLKLTSKGGFEFRYLGSFDVRE